MRKKPTNRALAIALLVLTWLATSCGGAVKFSAPPGMQELSAVGNSDKILKAHYPGKQGAFFTSHKATGSAPVYGVVFDLKDPQTAFVAGASETRSWSEPMALEGATLKVSSVVPDKAYMGDLQNDGSPELLFLVTIKSQDKATGTSQERRALYLYTLSKSLSLTWYKSLLVKGEGKQDCGYQSLDYTASPLFVLGKDKNVTGVTVTQARSSVKCVGGDGCKTAQTCEKEKDTATEKLLWDKELGVFVPEGKSEAVVKIPDISL